MKSLSSSLSAIAAPLFVAALVANPHQAAGATPTDVRATAGELSELEKAFWICDHAATKHGVDRHQAVICGAVTDELKVRKFSGEFEKMLDWWRLNKVVQHAALDRGNTAVANSESTDTMEYPD